MRLEVCRQPSRLTRSVLQNPRSTVGTIRKFTTTCVCYSRGLACSIAPECGIAVRAHSIGEISEEVRKIGRKSNALLILSPLIKDGAVKLKELLFRLEQAGAEEARVNGVVMKLTEVSRFKFDPQKKITVELLAGRVFDIKNKIFPR